MTPLTTSFSTSPPTPLNTHPFTLTLTSNISGETREVGIDSVDEMNIILDAYTSAREAKRPLKRGNPRKDTVVRNTKKPSWANSVRNAAKKDTSTTSTAKTPTPATKPASVKPATVYDSTQQYTNQYNQGYGWAGQGTVVTSSYHSCHTGSVKVFEWSGITFYGGGLGRKAVVGQGWLVINLTMSALSSIQRPGLKFYGVQPARLSKWASRREINLQVRDMQAPDYPKDFWRDLLADLREICDNEPDEKLSVLVMCQGGHGRTGTVLAVLMGMLGISKTPIRELRKIYCTHVVESKMQIEYVREMTGLPCRVKPAKLYGGAKKKKWSTPAAAPKTKTATTSTTSTTSETTTPPVQLPFAVEPDKPQDVNAHLPELTEDIDALPTLGSYRYKKLYPTDDKAFWLGVYKSDLQEVDTSDVEVMNAIYSAGEDTTEQPAPQPTVESIEKTDNDTPEPEQPNTKEQETAIEPPVTGAAEGVVEAVKESKDEPS